MSAEGTLPKANGEETTSGVTSAINTNAVDASEMDASALLVEIM